MKTIKQKILFDASPEDLYEAIINPKLHTEFTGSKATNSMKVGGKFTSWDGYAFGKNLVLEKPKKIMQEWSTSDFPEIVTEITFEFNKKGDKTELVFTQKNVPNENYQEISEGWKEFYWEPLKNWLAMKSKS